jgi:hypothetical protein
LKVSPAIKGSLEKSAIVKELSGFFDRIANSAGGFFPPNFNVAEVLLGQKLGTDTQAGIFSAVLFVIK